MDIGPWEIAIVAVVILIMFGSKKLPDAARSLGRSMRIMKTEIKGLHDDETPVAPAELATAKPANAETVSTEQTTSTS